MHITVSGHHIQVTPALEEHVKTKAKKLSTHIQPNQPLEVILTLENKHNHIAEAKIHVFGKTFVAKTDSENMYDSIDASMKKLLTQIEKHVAKHKEHHATG